MILWKQVSWLHTNLPQPFLRMWGSSPGLLSLSRRLAFGSGSYLRWYRLLREMETWTPDKIYEFQSSRIRRIVAHAFKEVPYYRDLFRKQGLRPSSIRTLDDLEKLPITTKSDIIDNYPKMFARGKPWQNNMYRETSGTTGRPIRFYLDSDGVAASWAGDRYFKEKMGYVMGEDPVLHIPLVNQPIYMLSSDRLTFGRYTPVTRQAIFPSEIIDGSVFESYLSAMKRHGIRRIEGFPSMEFAFAKYLQASGRGVEVDTVLAGSEMLYVFQRQAIEKQMGAEVFQKYAASESTIRAYECYLHQGMHISPYGIAEIKDQGLEGKGELVLTNHMNYLFPLIRYSSGDIMTLSKKPCACGSPFHRIMNIQGRSNDYLLLPDGRHIHPSPLAWSSVMTRGILDIYFLQHEDLSIDISVVIEKEADRDIIRKTLGARMDRLFMKELRYGIRFVDRIARKSSKFRLVETKARTSLNTAV